MSDKTDAWMPVYIADYLRDTQHLNTIEHGAYFLLLIKCWVERGILPIDQRRLARIAGLSPKQWRESGPTLVDFFIETKEGYTHKRVTEELARADANLEQRRAAGRSSAAQRALQRASNARSTSVPTSVPTGTSTKLQREGQRTPQRKSNASPSPESSLRSDSPLPPKFASESPQIRRVLEAGRFAAVPSDKDLVFEWLSLPNMELERDIVPMVESISGQEMARKGRAPFMFKFFDARIRERHAADEAEIQRLRNTRKRIEDQDRRQAAEGP